MSQRYFLETPIHGNRAELAGPEAHHALHVMRLREGDETTLFDGQGAEFAARVVATSRASLALEIIERRQIDREIAGELVLGVALPKGDRQKWLVEKATELGVCRLVPINTERGVAQPGDSALQRLRRAVVEASKQCGRNRLLELSHAVPLNEFLALAPPAATRLFAHPGGEALEQVLASPTTNSPTATPCSWVAIGPEGGFTDVEAASARGAGWRSISLGPRILRIETAALAIAAKLVM